MPSTIPYPEVTIIPTAELHGTKVLRNLKFAFLERVPGIKKCHLDEAIASGFGFPTRKKLLEALDGGLVVAPVSDDAFRARLSELGHDAPVGVFENLVYCHGAVFNLESGIQRCRPNGTFEFFDDGRIRRLAPPSNPLPAFNLLTPLASAKELLGETGEAAFLEAMRNFVPPPPRDPNEPNGFIENVVKPVAVATNRRRLPVLLKARPCRRA